LNNTLKQSTKFDITKLNWQSPSFLRLPSGFLKLKIAATQEKTDRDLRAAKKLLQISINKTGFCH